MDNVNGIGNLSIALDSSLYTCMSSQKVHKKNVVYCKQYVLVTVANWLKHLGQFLTWVLLVPFLFDQSCSIQCVGLTNWFLIILLSEWRNFCICRSIAFDYCHWIWLLLWKRWSSMIKMVVAAASNWFASSNTFTHLPSTTKKNPN